MRACLRTISWLLIVLMLPYSAVGQVRSNAYRAVLPAGWLVRKEVDPQDNKVVRPARRQPGPSFDRDRSRICQVRIRMLEPQIIEKPAMTIVGIETPFLHGLSPETNNFKVIPPLWEQFCKRSGEVQGRIGHAMYGIIYGRPEAERAHPHELQYIAGVQTQPSVTVPAGMVSRTVPAGTFAVFLHRGPIQKIGETCYEIYRVWLPKSPWQHADIADVEVYDERFECEGKESEMDYWISVVPR